MAWIPSVAAMAKREQEERQEREVLAALKRDDPEARYESKILRSHSLAFNRPVRLRAILEQESRAGWKLVTKLDSRRLVLQRPIARRASDTNLATDIDPYRETIDRNTPLVVALAGGLALVALVSGLAAFGGWAAQGVVAAALVGAVLVLGTLALARVAR